MYELKAELTATVWVMRAEVGQRVAAGDEIMILESMKMEIPVETEVSGVVSELLVGEGSAVAEGDVLALIETN